MECLKGLIIYLYQNRLLYNTKLKVNIPNPIHLIPNTDFLSKFYLNFLSILLSGRVCKNWQAEIA